MRSWLERGLAVLGAWLAVFGFAVFTDRHPNPFALGAGVAAVLAVRWLCVDAFDDVETPEWSLYRVPSPARTFDPRFSRLSQELNEATDRHAASTALHSNLNLAADRILHDKYDVNRLGEPDRARQILGEPIWSYLDAGPGTDKAVFSPQLFDVLDRLESL